MQNGEFLAHFFEGTGGTESFFGRTKSFWHIFWQNGEWVIDRHRQLPTWDHARGALVTYRSRYLLKVPIGFTFFLLNLRLYLIGGKSWLGVESGWAKTEVLTHYQPSTVKREACRCWTLTATILIGKRMDQTLASSLVNWRISALHGYL